MAVHKFETGTAFITVTPEKVVIEHKKGTYHGGKTKEIRIQSLTGIEIKEPGRILAGYIQFIFSGSSETQGYTRIDAVKNENTVTFSKKHRDDIMRCKSLVEEYMNNSKGNDKTGTSSTADELKKFADLRDQGVLTEEEFNQKKKQLLGI